MLTASIPLSVIPDRCQALPLPFNMSLFFWQHEQCREPAGSGMILSKLSFVNCSSKVGLRNQLPISGEQFHAFTRFVEPSWVLV